jgi:hypothetical protein
MEKGLPDQEGVWAAEGTAAHELGERCLKEGREPAEFWGEVMGEFIHKDGRVEQFVVDGDMVDAVEVYIGHCAPLIGDYTKIEQKLDLPFLGPDQDSKTGYVRGTADFISLVGNVLHVVDYKHGKYIPVEAVGNIQGLSYGIGAANIYDNLEWDTLRITIVQPRAYHPHGGVRSWDVDRGDLLDYKMDFANAAMRTFDDVPDIAAGKHCRFCKAQFQCKGMVEFIKENIGMDLLKQGSEPIDIHKLSEEQIVDILFNKIPIIKGWIAKLDDYAQLRAEQRDPLPGTKMVETRAYRKWVDPVVAEETLKHLDGVYEVKFKSAPQVEKLLGKKEFAKYEEKLVKKESSGVTLALISDDRPNVRPSGESQFAAVDLF